MVAILGLIIFVLVSGSFLGFKADYNIEKQSQLRNVDLWK